MPTFEVEWEETRRMIGWVEADSESAARQAWIDGDLDAQAQVGSAESRQFSFNEARHDRLCSCPSCLRDQDDRALEDFMRDYWTRG